MDNYYNPNTMSELAELKEKVVKLESQLAKLKEALEPFVEHSCNKENIPDSDILKYYVGNLCYIHFRQAKQVYDEVKGEKDV